MSLINEALKKAQRSRHNGQPADAPPVPGGSPIVKRSQPRSAKTVALIGGGAFALVLVSVVTTLFLLKSRSAAPTAPTSSTPAATSPKSAPATGDTATTAPASPAATTPAPGIAKPAETVATTPTPRDKPVAPGERAPTTNPPATPAKPAAATPTAATQPTRATPVASTAHPLPTPPPAAPATASAANPAPTPAQPAAPAPGATPLRDDRISAFVDAVRVTGIRSAGNDSRVLMNGQFFRVNDIVERTLGVRLVKVEVDSLTFADANGLTYVKFF